MEKLESGPRLFPKETLRIEQISSMTREECLERIQKAHHLKPDDLWKRLPNPAASRSMWNEEYLAKYALMLMEGNPREAARNALSSELSRKGRQVDLRPSVVAGVVVDYFSEKTKLRVALCERYYERRGLIRPADEKAEAALSAIEAETGMPRSEFLKVRSAPDSGTFSYEDILRAFLLRLRKQPFEKILVSLGKSEVGSDSLKVLINKNFTKKARDLLPRNIARNKARRGDI